MSRMCAAVVAMIAVLAIVGCDRGEPVVEPSRYVPPTRPSPTVDPPVYDSSLVDLCVDTDLALIADLALTIDKRRPDHPSGAEGPYCAFLMHNHADQPSNLVVHVSTPDTDDEARRVFNAVKITSSMTTEGPVTSLPIEALGRTNRSEYRGYKAAEYKIIAIDRNLVVEVFLSIGEDGYHPKADLKRRVEALTRSTIALVKRR